MNLRKPITLSSRVAQYALVNNLNMLRQPYAFIIEVLCKGLMDSE